MVKLELNWATVNKTEEDEKKKQIPLHARIISIKPPKIACTNSPSNQPLTIHNGLITAREAVTSHIQKKERNNECFFLRFFKEPKQYFFLVIVYTMSKQSQVK